MARTGGLSKPQPSNSKVKAATPETIGGLYRKVNSLEGTRDPKISSLTVPLICSHTVSLSVLSDLAESINKQKFSSSQTLS